jgi:hypothetical protein
VQVVAADVLIEGNRANAAAGIAAYTQPTVSLSNTTIQYNTATKEAGGIGIEGGATLHVDAANTVVRGNHAAEFGGGFVAYSKGFHAGDMLSVVLKNTARYDANIAVSATDVTIMGPSYVPGFVSRPGVGEGMLHVKLNVSGHYGLPCEGRAVAASLNILSSDVVEDYPMTTSSSDVHGLVNMWLRIQQPPGVYNITFELLENATVPPAFLSVEVRPCTRGEISPIPDTCQVCLPGSYSLHPSQGVCQPCPAAGATCPGGAAILPLPGWWHSAADSPQMHR